MKEQGGEVAGASPAASLERTGAWHTRRS